MRSDGRTTDCRSRRRGSRVVFRLPKRVRSSLDPPLHTGMRGTRPRGQRRWGQRLPNSATHGLPHLDLRDLGYRAPRLRGSHGAAARQAPGEDAAFRPERLRGTWRLISLFRSSEEVECFPNRRSDPLDRLSGSQTAAESRPKAAEGAHGAGPAGRVGAGASGVYPRPRVERLLCGLRSWRPRGLGDGTRNWEVVGASPIDLSGGSVLEDDEFFACFCSFLAASVRASL